MAQANKNNKPKAPQDHLPKQADQEPEKPEGWDLIKPLDQIPVWEQTELLQTLKEAFGDQVDVTEISVQEFDMRIIGKIALALRGWAKNAAEYDRFVSGQGAMQRAMDIATYAGGLLGESDSSTDNS